MAKLKTSRPGEIIMGEFYLLLENIAISCPLKLCMEKALQNYL